MAIATKSDRVDRKRLAEHLIAVDQLGDWADIVPCSATSGDQVDTVAAVLALAPAELAGPLSPRCHHRRAGRRVTDRRVGPRGLGGA